MIRTDESVAQVLLWAIALAGMVVVSWIAGATAVLGFADDANDWQVWFWAVVALIAVTGLVACLRRVRRL